MSGISSGYKDAANPGNQSGVATNSKVGTEKASNAPSAQEVAGTLPADFSLKNLKHDTKGSDLTTSNESEGRPGEPLSTLGSGGDTKRTELQSHDIDLPGQTSAGAGTQNEAKGISRDDQRT